MKTDIGVLSRAKGCLLGQCAGDALGQMVEFWSKKAILHEYPDGVQDMKNGGAFYPLADPNWNVVAITNASGTVLERMRYDAFGKVTWLNASFATQTGSYCAWNRTFTGQVLDSESGLMLYRNRFYHTGLGRFVQRDPIGYVAEDVSLYRYVFNATGVYVDPFGYDVWVETPPNARFPGHQRVCVDVPPDCEEAAKCDKGKPYCITFYNDGRGGCSRSARCSDSCDSVVDCAEYSAQCSSSSCQKTGGTANTKIKCDLGSTLPSKFPKNSKGAGMIGPDNKAPSKGKGDTLGKPLSSKQNCEVYKYFKNLEGTRGNYRFDGSWFGGYNCRDFSQDIYNIIEDRY